MDRLRSTRRFFNGQLLGPQPAGPPKRTLGTDKAATAPRAPPPMELSAPAGSEGLAAVLRSHSGDGQGRCLRLFVAGAVSHVGKTTVCLSLLHALRSAGLRPEDLAYVKPATQCEAPDLLARWCEAEGIQHVSGDQAPLVFYSGFTRSFLAGEQGTSAQWLEKIGARVDALAQGRRVLLIDGVGFPSVGSIVGVDNADVARATRAPVLLVCKSGVGAAVDSFSLNCSYFGAKGVPVLGSVFNFGALDGAYSWEKCAENISLFFDRGGRRERYYGVVPMAPQLDGLRERIADTAGPEVLELARLNAEHFARHVDLGAVFGDAAADAWNRQATSATATIRATAAEGLGVFAPKQRNVVAPAAKGGG